MLYEIWGHQTILELNSVWILAHADTKEISLAHQINLRHNDIKVINFSTYSSLLYIALLVAANSTDIEISFW